MPAKIAPARGVAFDILRKIGRELGNSDSLLHSNSVDRLSQPDRNLCTALVLGTLRWQRVLDAECRPFLARPGLALPPDATLALRLGAYQLLFLDRVPVHAAIFESVEWVKQSEAARQAGLVNAVLRKVAALPKGRGYDAELAYPDWVVARWRRFYGADACRRICEEGQQAPRTAARLLHPGAEEKLLAAGRELAPGRFVARARYLLREDDDGGDGTSVDVQLQEEGSQLVAELVGVGERILDCCAAPGGKTAVLRQNNPRARLLACDIHPSRLAAMRTRLAGLPNADAVEFRLADVSRLGDVGPFDRILCDAPCTGTGTLARNPEIRHRLQLADLQRQAERQRAILQSALALLAPGGRLLYATCSLEPEENEAVVEACLRAIQGSVRTYRKLDLRDAFDRLIEQGMAQGEAVAQLRSGGFRNGNLRTLPGVHPCDGFFAAMIERV
jgi:16S rRNA (cytosine967-C5)-methyltransferase